uniref:Secreted protein n=1 Tax=Steinernema glaseri TaxID=37863 RepID=A0A1I7YAY9_9BILA
MLSLVAVVLVLSVVAPDTTLCAEIEDGLYQLTGDEVLKLGRMLTDSLESSRSSNFRPATNPLRTHVWPGFSGQDLLFPDLLFPVKQCTVNGKTFRGMFQCPSRQRGTGDVRCVKYGDLCDGHPECPDMEDEHPLFCLFHKLHESEMSTLRRLVDHREATHPKHKKASRHMLLP